MIFRLGEVLADPRLNLRQVYVKLHVSLRENAWLTTLKQEASGRSA